MWILYMLFETLSVLVYFYAVFTSIVIWKGLMCTVSSAMDQFPYLHTLHVTWKPALPLKKKNYRNQFSQWKRRSGQNLSSLQVDMIKIGQKVTIRCQKDGKWGLRNLLTPTRCCHHLAMFSEVEQRQSIHGIQPRFLHCKRYWRNEDKATPWKLGR